MWYNIYSNYVPKIVFVRLPSFLATFTIVFIHYIILLFIYYKALLSCIAPYHPDNNPVLWRRYDVYKISRRSMIDFCSNHVCSFNYKRVISDTEVNFFTSHLKLGVLLELVELFL